jgi:diguanylate cyclase (GGDEF)-like protein
MQQATRLDGADGVDLSPLWMARALGLLYTAGASLTLAWVLVPHPDGRGDVVVVVMAMLALGLGITLVTIPVYRLPAWVLHAVLAAIQVVITVAYVAVGIPGNDLRLFYAWATPYAAFFFGRRAALAHSLWTVACLTAGLMIMDGPTFPSVRVWLTTVGLVVAVGSLVGIVAGRMRAGRRLLHAAATHDPLTGLANRRGFATALDDALAQRDEHGGSVVVLLVDLDHFKLVNDTHGHHAGDDLLCEVAPRLTAVVRAGDTVARMGGDEFAVVCRDEAGNLDVAALLDRLQRTWAAPVVVDAGELTVTGSVGVVVCDRPGATAESLLRDADVALYRAKAVRRGSAVVFDATLQADNDRRSAVERELRSALSRGELGLAFQPVVGMTGADVLGAEALLRWTSAELGSVPPAEFIPVAEDSGLIGEIGAWVLDQSCAQLSEWRSSGLVGEDFAIAVNVSGRQLSPGFTGRVAAVRERYGLPARALHIEITESVLLDEAGGSAAVLTALRAAGTPLLLDDFGTGYSSLAYLQRLPLDGLKIDKSFVDGLDTSARRRTLVAAIVAMADGLGLDVVAEGVETEQVAAALRALGCRHAQGYLWGRPMGAQDFAEHLMARRGGPVPAAGSLPV